MLQAGKTVGYVFSTGTVAPMPGFSGTPIDLAVAINREGEFLDIEILNQKEPVFVGGLGTAPFIEFLNQYRGKSLRQNISVGSAYGNRARQAGDGVVLDGVSKASASVRIANVTILTSARAVAGVPLNGGGRAPPARPRPDVKEILPWNELLSRHLLGHLALDNLWRVCAAAPRRCLSPPPARSHGRSIRLLPARASLTMTPLLETILRADLLTFISLWSRSPRSARAFSARGVTAN